MSGVANHTMTGDSQKNGKNNSGLPMANLMRADMKKGPHDAALRRRSRNNTEVDQSGSAGTSFAGYLFNPGGASSGYLPTIGAMTSRNIVPIDWAIMPR